MAEHDKDSSDASKALRMRLASFPCQCWRCQGFGSKRTSAHAVSCSACLEASLLAKVGFHVVVSAYWVSMPTVADIVIVIGTSAADLKGDGKKRGAGMIWLICNPQMGILG